ncbi:MAG: glucose-6-phosphate dehydrogenase [Acidobacteria bacterium]|nr:glucose-6-phosphate dehydrogenase [Acidobacteriota bacterium]
MTATASATEEISAPNGAHKPRVADPCAVVLFGASGDLAMRKLLPAIYNLKSDGLLSDHFTLVGVGRDPMAREQYQEKVRRDLERFGPQPVDRERMTWIADRATYITGAYDSETTYRQLSDTLLGGDGPRSVLFYLATPPSLFEPIIERLGSVGLADEAFGAWRRVIIEKPFGRDLETARELNHNILSVLRESQVYRIDHYLGKETVQNIMALRFGNGIFEPLWNRSYINHVQITVAETVGVEQRGGYYDTSGALRDMVQNHLFQLLAVTTMEPPSSFQAEPVRDERLKVLEAVRPYTAESAARDVVRGQYGAGENGARQVPGYLAEPKVAPDSETESYVALKVLIDNWRWAEVPFYLRTGKRMPTRVTEIAVQFKGAPHALFRETQIDRMHPNWLVLRIQPKEGISLQFEAKVPGPRVRLDTVKMDFSYADYFGQSPNTGYETLLYDCMIGDATLFHRADVVETGWDIVKPLQDSWQETAAAPVESYAAGSWGPAGADTLLRRDGRAWREPVA